MQWRKGAPPVVTDERGAFVANLERTTKAVEKEQRELEIGRKRLDVGRRVRGVIDQQQGPGDALTQIAKPQVVLHNAPRPDTATLVVAPPPPQPPGGGGGAVARGARPDATSRGFVCRFVFRRSRRHQRSRSKLRALVSAGARSGKAGDTTVTSTARSSTAPSAGATVGRASNHPHS